MRVFKTNSNIGRPTSQVASRQGAWECQRESWGDSAKEEAEAEERLKAAVFKYPRKWR